HERRRSGYVNGPHTVSGNDEEGKIHPYDHRSPLTQNWGNMLVLSLPSVTLELRRASGKGIEVSEV
ncbi:hypothetical protein J1N35_019214, partial [Gossypium stocksii]